MKPSIGMVVHYVSYGTPGGHLGGTWHWPERTD